MSLHQKLLSAGLEAFDAPPAAPVVAAVVPAPFDNNAPVSEDPELIREETAARLAIIELIESERDTEMQRDGVAELRRLSDGLEGLMVEIQNVNNPEEPTEDEMAMLKATAKQVRKELLEDDEQELVINVENGILVGSQEGLADALSNVAKKIGFALGNAAKSVLSKSEQSKKPITYNRKLVVDLKAKIAKLGTTEFAFTMPKAMVKFTRVQDSGPVNALDAAKGLPAALDAWYLTPADDAPKAFDKHYALLEALFASTSREGFDANYAKFAALTAPTPSTAKKLSPINANNFIFDVMEDHPSMGHVSRFYYVARPEADTNPVEKAKGVITALHQYATFVGLFDKLSDRKGDDEQVTLSAADIQSMLDAVTQSCDVMEKYLSRLAVMSTFDTRYNALIDKGEAMRKQEWVGKDVIRLASGAHGALEVYYAYGFAYTNAAFEMMEHIISIVKKAVYKSDLSK